jgi:hypothetical protein
MASRLNALGPEPFVGYVTAHKAADKVWHDWTRHQTGQTMTGEYVHVFERSGVWCAFNLDQHDWNISWQRRDHLARWYAFVSMFDSDQIVFTDTWTDLIEQAADRAEGDSCGGWAVAASALLALDHPESDAARTLASLGGLGGVIELERQRAERMKKLRDSVRESLR